jgi:hypothetical protein
MLSNYQQSGSQGRTYNKWDIPDIGIRGQADPVAGREFRPDLTKRGVLGGGGGEGSKPGSRRFEDSMFKESLRVGDPAKSLKRQATNQLMTANYTQKNLHPHRQIFIVYLPAFSFAPSIVRYGFQSRNHRLWSCQRCSSNKMGQ